MAREFQAGRVSVSIASLVAATVAGGVCGMFPLRVMSEELPTQQMSNENPDASDTWPGIVDEFALRLVSPGQEIKALIREKAGARAFDDTRVVPLSLAAKSWSTFRLISARAYRAPAVSVASDLAADLSAAGDVPQELIEQLVPNNTDELRRKGDATALKFLDAVLDPKLNEPIGVIALLDASGKQPRLVLVLIRGVDVPTETQNQLRVSGAIFGDLDQAIAAK